MSFLSAEALHGAGPLLTLAVVLALGMIGGAIAKRLRLPSITGQIVAGLVIGKVGFDLFGEEDLHALQPLTHFALGLMAVTVGAHLNIRRLRNAGKRLFLLLIFEATITPLLVFEGMVRLGGVEPLMAALFATAAIATAPATVVAVVGEARAKGVFVKTLIAAVALNNMACIFLFEVARAFAGNSTAGSGLDDVLSGPLIQLMFAICIGGLMGIIMEVVSRYVVQAEKFATAAVLALVLTSGLATYWDVSPLLACLFLGFVQTNLTSTRDRLVDTVFGDFQPAILAIFFTLAGMHLSFESFAATGLLAGLLFSLRFTGKLIAGTWAMRFARATSNVRRNLGLALIPQAGVAVALVILIQDDPNFSDKAASFGAVVLAVVTLNELLGPVTLRYALHRSGEAGMDRQRLFDFLQEENISTEFSANDKPEAIEKLVDLMISSHHMQAADREALLESVLNREAQASTCLGAGLSVPHGILPSGHPLVGVMAISREGLNFPTPDGLPVHCMVLLGTSAEERDRHLQVLAMLARSIGSDEEFQGLLYAAKSAAHASELLHSEDSMKFNYFLDDKA